MEICRPIVEVTKVTEVIKAVVVIRAIEKEKLLTIH